MYIIKFEKWDDQMCLCVLTIILRIVSDLDISERIKELRATPCQSVRHCLQQLGDRVLGTFVQEGLRFKGRCMSRCVWIENFLRSTEVLNDTHVYIGQIPVCLECLAAICEVC